VKKQQHTKGYVYILKSIPNSGYYIGSTIDIQKRFSEHNDGYVKSTRNLRPLELKYFKMYDDIKTARQIEYRLKRLKSRCIIERIIAEREIKLAI